MAQPTGDWNPRIYAHFAGPRLRPVADLAARLPATLPPGAVYDLGCGSGAATGVLQARFPDRPAIGIDRSPAMLAAARQAVPGADFDIGDIAQWAPRRPAALIFSNAALHWLDDHARLFPRLAGQLVAGGVLAVQMPANFDAPSHRAFFAAAADCAISLPDELTRLEVLTLTDYHALLAPLVTELDLWETTYIHRLRGEDPVLDWLRTTLIRPLEAHLPPEAFARFLDAFRHRLGQAYRPGPDGVTLYGFRRRFIVAQRR